MIASLRALLALVLLAGLYVLAALMGLLWLGFAALSVVVFSSGRSGSYNTTPMLAAAATAVPVALVLREVARISAPAGPLPGSVPVSEAAAPGLWRAVRELAALVGTAAPAEIRLTAEVNAAVTDSGRLLGLGRGSRRLYLGAPLLAGLDEAELRAVLAHELGHYARHHAWFTGPAYRGVSALAEAAGRIRAAMLANDAVRLYAGPVALAVALYAAVFDRLTLPVRRRQEIEADRVAAAVAGAAALAAALRAMPALTAGWERFRHLLAEPYRLATGRVPDDPFHPFAAMLEDPDVRERLAVLRAGAEEIPAVRGDSHPALSVRLDRLSRLPAGGTAAVAVPTLSDVDTRLLRRLAGVGTGRRRPWREWVAELAAHRAAELAGPLRAALVAVADERTVPACGPTLGTVLDLLDAGRSTDLARALAGRPGPDPDLVDRAGLAAAACAVIGRGLVDTGSAYWVMGWVGPSRLVAADPAVDGIPGWVAAAVDDPRQVSWLRLQLAALGVDDTAVPVQGPAVPPGGTGRGRTATVVVGTGIDPVSGRRRRDIAYPSLAVLVVLLVAGGIGLASRDDPPPYRPGGRMVVGPDGRLVPATGVPGAPYAPVPVPTVGRLPVDGLPTVPLPSVPLPSVPLPSVRIVPLPASP